MANYKVVFHKDLEKDRGSMSWEPWCPVLVEAVQVSRDTDSGNAFLQLKIQNVSTKTVDEVTLGVTVSYSAEPEERVRVQQLDCALAPGKSLALKPKLLAHGDVAGVSVAAGAVKGSEISWESAGTLVAIPFPKPLRLDEKALAERARLVSDRAANAASVEGDGWWICGCGQVNVGSGKCLSCGAKLSDSLQYQDEATLHESADDLAYRNAAKSESEGTLASLRSAKSGFESLGGYRDAAKRTAECSEKIDELTYEAAVADRAKRTELSLAGAIEAFESLGGYRDSSDQAAESKIELDALKKKKIRIAVVIGIVAVIAVAAYAVLEDTVIRPMQSYNSAMELYEQGDYESAYAAFTDLGDYKNSQTLANELAIMLSFNGSPASAFKIESIDKNTIVVKCDYPDLFVREGAEIDIKYSYTKKSEHTLTGYQTYIVTEADAGKKSFTVAINVDRVESAKVTGYKPA
jgi:TolA-binding protein